jgi:hypothetical protein
LTDFFGEPIGFEGGHEREEIGFIFEDELGELTACDADEIIFLPRFGDVMVEVGEVDGFDGGFESGVGGEEDFAGGGGGGVVLEFDEERDAVIAGEDMIADDETEFAAWEDDVVDGGAGFVGAGGGFDVEGFLEGGEVTDDGFEDFGFIFDAEDVDVGRGVGHGEGELWRISG